MIFDYKAENVPLSREIVAALADGEKVYFEAAPHALGVKSGWRILKSDAVVGKRIVADDGDWSALDGNFGRLFRVWPFRPFRNELEENAWPENPVP